MRFEKLVTLFELVVLMNGIQIHRAHVIQLGSQLGDKLFQIWSGELRRARRCRSSVLELFFALELCTQNFFQCGLISRKPAKINLVTARNVRDEVVDLHLQLRFAHLPLCATILQFT